MHPGVVKQQQCDALQQQEACHTKQKRASVSTLLPQQLSGSCPCFADWARHVAGVP